MPIVAIVGRANVGKSSLFNRLTQKRQAIVAREAGTTRNRISATVSVDDGAYLLIDTAGLKAANDDFEQSIQDHIEDVAETADLVVVVVEAGTQVTNEDRQVAKSALKSKKPVLLVVNKSDQAKEESFESWKRLGIKQIISTSAIHNQGISQLSEAITSSVSLKQAVQDITYRIALVGRPNVGKSSLFNSIAKKQEALVSDKAGTTRDVTRTTIRYHSKSIELLDTAGIRRSGKIEVGVEKFSVIRAISAIEEADICLMVIDANEPLTKLDQSIAGMIKEAGKGLILVVNKWDSIDKDSYTHQEMTKKIALEYQFINWAPIVFLSALTGENVIKLLELSDEIYSTATRKFQTKDLNRWLKSVTAHHPPAGLKKFRPKLKYLVQTSNNPLAFTIHGKDVNQLHWSYQRYLDRELRSAFEISGAGVIWRYQND